MSHKENSDQHPLLKECRKDEYGRYTQSESETSSSSPSPDTEKEKLVRHTDDPGDTRKYWYRWYICLIFALFGLFQGAIWNTWSPIDDSAEVALGFTADDITLLANWGPITFLIAMPVFMWLLHNKGLRVAVVPGAFLVALGSGLRCLPVDVVTLRYLIHAGQILNGISGCPVMAAAPLLSNVWFPPEERVTATAISTLFNYLGTGAGFIFGPMFVQDPSNGTRNISKYCLENSTKPHNEICAEIYKIQNQISHTMYFEFAISAAIFLCMLIFFPKKPPSPPSISASAPRLDFKVGILALRRKRQFWVIAVTNALVFGTWGGWTGTQSLLLKPLGVAQTESSFIGFVTTLIGCGIGMFVGWFTDRLKGRTKRILVLLYIISLVTFVYFVILANKWFKFVPFLPQKGAIWTVMVILGITMNAAVPIGMEMAADAAYPVGEGISTSIVVWLFNLLSFTFLLGLNVSPNPVFANYIMLGGIAIALPVVALGTRDINQRLQLDTGEASQVEPRVAKTSASSYGSMDCAVNTSQPDQTC